MGQLGELWQRISATQPPLPIWTVALCLAVAAAVVLLSPIWRPARHAITIVHEAGHGFAATLTGRRLAGIRLHSDTSGVTVSVGRPRGFGMALTLLAGYPAAALLGLGAAWLIGIGHATGMLWALLAILLLVLVQIRNWFGLWSVLVVGIAVFAATWLLDPAQQAIAASTITAFLLLGSLRTSVELQSSRRREGAGRGRGDSDADQLARLSGLPGLFWVAVFVLIALACTLLGGLLLLRIDPAAFVPSG
ncbi:M50 family metallopeptidase [Amnibacterium flavum]|uniref:M50 family peptidase n=1 Tax=Amnibacterium flavum TaxID=2173173 RepID=A0A2V1HMG2_9MICO|nr:M50 family metallopeptidase [Amnibacterium flavum]PVZ93601.1 hypothetical protein DDQ50_14935 [Amnibacterium flavum]